MSEAKVAKSTLSSAQVCAAFMKAQDQLQQVPDGEYALNEEESFRVTTQASGEKSIVRTWKRLGERPLPHLILESALHEEYKRDLDRWALVREGRVALDQIKSDDEEGWLELRRKMAVAENHATENQKLQTRESVERTVTDCSGVVEVMVGKVIDRTKEEKVVVTVPHPTQTSLVTIGEEGISVWWPARMERKNLYKPAYRDIYAATHTTDKKVYFLMKGRTERKKVYLVCVDIKSQTETLFLSPITPDRDSDFSMVAAHGGIYVFGMGKTQQTYFFSIAGVVETWMRIPHPGFLAVVVVKGELVAFGDSMGQSYVRRFNRCLEVWEMLESGKQAKSCKLAVLGTCVWAITKKAPHVRCFDTKDNRWVKNIPQPWSYMPDRAFICVMAGCIYLLGNSSWNLRYYPGDKKFVECKFMFNHHHTRLVKEKEAYFFWG